MYGLNFYICFFLRTFASSATCQKWLETRNIAITKSDRCVLDTTWHCCTNSGVDPTGIYIYILCDSDVSAKFNCNCAEYIYIPPKIYAKQFVVLWSLLIRSEKKCLIKYTGWRWLSIYEVSLISVHYFGHDFFDKCTCMFFKKHRFPFNEYW